MSGGPLVFEYMYSSGARLSCVPEVGEGFRCVVEDAGEVLSVPLVRGSVVAFTSCEHGNRLRLYSTQHVDEYLTAEQLRSTRQAEREAVLAEMRRKEESAQRRLESLEERRKRKQDELGSLRQGVLEFVRRVPGKGVSFYEREPERNGGLPGSQERKEKVMRELLESGELKLVKLDKPKGRLTHGVYPADVKVKRVVVGGSDNLVDQVVLKVKENPGQSQRWHFETWLGQLAGYTRSAKDIAVAEAKSKSLVVGELVGGVYVLNPAGLPSAVEGV